MSFYVVQKCKKIPQNVWITEFSIKALDRKFILRNFQTIQESYLQNLEPIIINYNLKLEDEVT